MPRQKRTLGHPTIVFFSYLRRTGALATSLPLVSSRIPLQSGDNQGVRVELSQHTPGQSGLSSPRSETIVNSPLFYTIDLLPPSPNSQVFVELLSCSFCWTFCPSLASRMLIQISREVPNGGEKQAKSAFE